ncbi:MAG: hypothetical protein NTY30_03475 [Candidatus Berkelbacteria bacterium]|nr:hypothetical protein [Candidatus Berkelbacteria bacterium]
MRTLKVKNLTAKIVLSFLVLWGVASFFIFPTLPIFQWAMLLIALFTLYFTLTESSGYFVLILITFSSTYFFYGLQFAYGFPLWAILIGLGFFLVLTFWFLGRQLIANNGNFLLVLTFFLISILEIYLALSFWLINPLTKSLMMGIFSYLFAGYLSNISDTDTINNKFSIYLYIAIFTLLILVFTVSWGR